MDMKNDIRTKRHLSHTYITYIVLIDILMYWNPVLNLYIYIDIYSTYTDIISALLYKIHIRYFSILRILMNFLIIIHCQMSFKCVYMWVT